jgi:antitoxin component YwqK of YwqJK toxin-antitoxin module
VHYKELLPRSSAEERKELVSRRQRLETTLDQSSIKRLKGEIESLTSSMADKDFDLPVHEIEALNRKRLMCSKLAELCRKNGEEELKASALASIREIESQVAALETQRDEVVLERNDDGSMKRRFRKRDGELNGKTEAFYPDGTRRFLADFVGGKFEGNAEYCRDDGSLAFRINPVASGHSNHRLFLPAGQKIAECDLLGADGTASVWLWDGYFIARTKIIGGRANKALLLLKIVFKPGFWARLWRAKSNPSDGAHLQTMQATVVSWDGFLSELKELVHP